MMLCFCSPAAEGEEPILSAVEAIELVHMRMRDVSGEVSRTESQMVMESTLVRRAAQQQDMEKARLHMRRIRALRERRTRYLGCRERLWAMKETLMEQSHHASVQRTFAEGLQVAESLLQKVDLSKVEDAMDRLEDVMADTRDIGAELGREHTFVSENDDDDDAYAVEQELRLLMNGVQKDDEEAEQKELVLPTTPTHTPSEAAKSKQHHERSDAKVPVCEG